MKDKDLELEEELDIEEEEQEELLIHQRCNKVVRLIYRTAKRRSLRLYKMTLRR